MVRRFSWCTTVALVVLLFVTTEGLGERGSQVDDQKSVSRGVLRYNTKPSEESTTAPSFLRSRSSQSKQSFNLRSPIDTDSVFDSTKHSRSSSEPPVNRRNGKRYSPERRKSKDNENVATEGSRLASRRISTVTERLDNKGPSVFAVTTESSRSRTGRKIQTTYPSKDLKTQIPTSRRYSNKKLENVETTTASFRRDGRGRSTTERIERSTRSGRSKVNNRENNSIGRKGQETALFESESVRVDIPLAVEGTENPSGDIVTTSGFGVVSQRRSDTKETLRGNGRTAVERSKGRGRSNDSEVAGSSRNSSRRGSSKFNDFSTTEANEQISSRKSTASRDRSKNLEGRKNAASESRSRSRSRGSENNARNGVLDVKRKSVERNPLDRRSRLTEVTSRSVDNRGQDQDSRKSRSRSRPDVTTPLTTDVTTTVAPDTTVFTDVTTESEITMKPASPAPSTTSSRPSTTSRPSSSSSTTTEGSGRGRGRGRGGNQGRKQQKEDFFNHGLGFRGRKPSLEGPSNTGESRKPIVPKNDTQYHGNLGWTLRRRPPNANYTDSPPKAIPTPRDQTNEVIPPNELSTSTEIVTSVDSSTSTTRRGFKKPQSTEESTTEIDATTKSFRRGNKTFGIGKATDHEESDNYPPDFKARLIQLKSTNTKIPALKTTPRSPLEVKRSSAALFAERSRMKLELARRLVKPELNIEENDLDATTASSFSAPTINETNKLGKLVKPSLTRRTSTEKRSREDEKLRDSSSRLARPSSKKGRIISERMVTSISVEERSAIEDTTKPYSSTGQSVVTLASAEQGSATTIDSTRIRPSNLRNGKKSKEEHSTNKRRLENTDTITTFKPKKPYVYQSRGTKLPEQSTTPENSSTVSKKNQTKYNGGQRKSQTSREEDRSTTDFTKPTFRPRYSKRTKPKSSEDFDATITTKVPVATSRYSRKKAVVKAVEGKSKTTTEGIGTQTKKVEFRPRTATYRRHSEVPTTLVESSTKVDGTRVAITPRPTKSQTETTENARSVAQEPQVNLRIANETVQEPGITGSSNGDSGNTNIFNPTRSSVLTGNNTLLEQLRSTVAPLLNSLGNKTPVFSGSYSNVNNANSAPRITPNGSPPRFSARYKGAELFVRKQNNVYQPTVPSITSSSTTPATTVENSGSAPPVDVSSPGEPRFLTLYHALESADIRNEQLQGNAREQADRVLQSNAPVNTQTGTASVTPQVSTGRPAMATDSQGGRIVQDRERDEATRTKEVEGQRSSVYIGQDKFVNYWTDQASTANPQVLGVNINSVATASNVGPSPSVPSFENLLNNQQGGGRVTAPPGFPWRDPLDQIFGITTSSPIITASVASNTLDDSSESNNPALTRPVNPFVEVFTPLSNAIGTPTGNGGTSVTGAVPSTTTTTTMPTTTTMAPTTSTTMAPTTVSQVTTNSQAANVVSQGTLGSTANPLPSTTPFNVPASLLTNMQQQNAFGTSFNDLVFLNSLLQSNSRSSNSKSLTQVEQLLANKILSLALNGPDPGPTRSPKAISYENASPNSVFQSPKSPFDPIVIDLSPSSTAKASTWKSLEQTSQKPSASSSTPTQITWQPITSSTVKTNTVTSTASSPTTLISTTKAPVTVSSKPVTTPRPRTTTEAPLGLAGLLWQSLLGREGLFGPSTTQRPVKSKQVKTTTKSVNITPKPPQTTQKPDTTTTARTTTTTKPVDISKIYVSTPNSILGGEKKTATSTYSPEEDTKFLLSLLRAVQQEEKASGAKKSAGAPQDDEAFLRAILSGRPLTTTPPPQTEISNAALLAALLKAQGIEPETPATNIREQLQLASLGQSVTSAPTASPATSKSTTITTRPTSAATRPTDTTKNTPTPRPTSRPRIRTTTWSPSSTYPPPLFSSFSNYDTPVQLAGDHSENRALFGATRAFSQFLGAALSGAAQQLQSLVRNGTRIVSEVVG